MNLQGDEGCNGMHDAEVVTAEGITMLNWALKLKKIKITLPIFVMGLVLLSYGCSRVGFQSQTSQSCEEYNLEHGEDACVMTPDGLNAFRYSVIQGQVEILFVVDNSYSMHVEQKHIAEQFPRFLETIKHLDYRIAIITTDISRSPYNQSGRPWQDGKFLNFPNGQRFLENPTRSDSIHQQNIFAFQQTIFRPETFNCRNDRTTCPSGDERGIFALNMAIDRSENSSFFRPGAHLAIVIISDEDNRSVGGGAQTALINRPLNPHLFDNPLYQLRDYDLGETFLKKFSRQMDPSKTLSFHSIIVRPKVTKTEDGNVLITRGHPEGERCFLEQRAQSGGVDAYFGTQYARLSMPSDDLKQLAPLMDGYMGSICAQNYTLQMGPIAEFIRGISLIQLACPAIEDTIEIEFAPEPEFSITLVQDLDDPKRLHLTPEVPAGTQVNLRYSCERD